MATSSGVGAAAGLTGPADPDGDGDPAELGGPLPANRIGVARSGHARDAARAAPRAAGEPEPSAGQGDVTAAAGRPPPTGEEGRDEPWVSGEDDEGLPAPRVAAAGATADPVRDYLTQIGKVPLLTAGQEVELAKQIEVALFAEHKLAGGSAVLRAGQRTDLERVAEDGRRAKDHLLADGQPKTLDEIGKVYGVTRERIRQIESQAMCKLRNPSRSRRLRDYLD